MDKVIKVPRTVYIPKELDDYLSQRMSIEGRNRSVLIERLVKKALEGENKINLEAIPND